MEPGELEQIKEVFYIATEQSPEQRLRFLAEACRGNEGLRAEVERLLDEHDRAGGFLESPFANIVSIRHLPRREQTVKTNQMIAGRYRVVSLLGEGGMGVVYKAEDTRLPRFVALKSLGWALVGDAASLVRLRREAQAASTLNHPNICTIHDVVESEGQMFIVMEYLDGQTLREMIPSGCLKTQDAMPQANAVPHLPDNVIRIATQIIEGLEAAHDKGIVHRDIKPANIFVTKAGLVKVLDFGIATMARALDTVAASADGMQASLNLEEHLTNPVAAAGTIGYMSPEQVGAKELDARTDLFSFGTVLYEMTTGTMPFAGQSTKVVLNSILNKEVLPATRLNPEIPPQLEKIIGKCLQKDRDLRYQSAADIRADLQQLKMELELRSTAPGQSGGISRNQRLQSASGSPGTSNLLARDSDAIARGVPPATSQVLDSAARRAAPGSPAAQLSGEETGKRGLQRFSGVKAIGLAAVLAITLALAAYIRVRLLAFPDQPKVGRIDGSSLVILDGKGKELWSENFPDGFGPDWYYNDARWGPRIWFADLEGKGHTSVLFSYSRAGAPLKPQSTTLICYSDRGKEKWRWNPGRNLPELNGSPATYMTHSLQILKATKNSPAKIVVASQHSPWWPTQIALVDSNGKTISEYWHSGGLEFITLADLDGDGKQEIIATGVANGYDHKAALVVLDPDKVFGASSETRPEFQIHGMGTAHERLRLLFERSDLNRALNQFDIAMQPTFDNGILRLTVAECITSTTYACPIWYEFDRNFHLIAAFAGGDDFRSAHNRFYQTGKDAHTLSTDEQAAFLKVRCLVGCKTEFVPVGKIVP
jgi:serine/threonine protein kinase